MAELGAPTGSDLEMAEAELESLFDRLRAEGYQITSQQDPGHNCVAYSLGDEENWWDPNHPDGFWPAGVSRDDTLDGFVALFESQGFARCRDANVEEGFEKIAIYGNANGDFLHVAKQLQSGIWKSKLGELEDIEHSTLNGLVSVHYGEPLIFMKRARP